MTGPMDITGLFTPDDDASALDRRIMDAARQLHEAGWTDEAQQVAASAAYLRETPGQQIGTKPSELYDALQTLATNAELIAKVIADTYPDDIAVR